MKTLPIKAFRFLGGDRSELETERSLPGYEGWRNILKKLASTHPSVFPTHPLPIPFGVRRYAFVNLPIRDMSGYRAHCVYFSYTGTRTFWNVLCFAYRESDCPMIRTLASVSADEWYRIGTSLTDETYELNIAEEETAEVLEPPLPPCEAEETLFYRFPTAQGKVLTRADDDWEATLSEARVRPVQEPLAPEKRDSILKKFMGRRKKKAVIPVVVVGVALLVVAVDLIRYGVSSRETSCVASADNGAAQQAAEAQESTPAPHASDAEETPAPPQKTSAPASEAEPADNDTAQQAADTKESTPAPHASDAEETPAPPQKTSAPASEAEPADNDTAQQAADAQESTPAPHASDAEETPAPPQKTSAPASEAEPADNDTAQQAADAQESTPAPHASDAEETPAPPQKTSAPASEAEPADNDTAQQAADAQESTPAPHASDAVETSTTPQKTPAPSPEAESAPRVVEESDTD